MGLTLLQVVLIALLGALMPARMLAVSTLLATRQPVLNATGFTVACTLGYLAMAFLIGSAAWEAHLIDPAPTGWVTRVELLLGLLLLVFSIRTLRRRDVPSKRMPRMVERLHSVGTGPAIAAGLALGIAGVRNVVILIAVTGLVSQDGRGITAMAVALLLTIAIFSIPMLTPIGIYVLAPARSAGLIDTGEQRLLSASRAITLAVGFGLGAYLVMRSALRFLGV